MFSQIRNPKDFFTGLILLGVVAIYTLGLFDLRIGTLSRPGPGYFPLILTSLLFVFAVAILINGLRGKGEPVGAIPWRAVILVTAAVVFFGFTIKGLGLVLALGIAVVLSCMASVKWNAIQALTTAAVLVFFTWLVFLWGLGLPVSLCGAWIRDVGLALGIPARTLLYCY
jgi:hypothetical protein